MNADKILEQAAATFRERNALYADNYKRIGAMMHAMFRDGLTINTPEDWTRMYFVMAIVTKLSRYGAQWQSGGHKDSAHDAIVYAAMLEAYDDRSTP